MSPYYPTDTEVQSLRHAIEVELETQTQAAKRLGVDPGTIRRWCTRYAIKTQRTGPRAGARHPDWLGGRTIDKNGYVLLYRPGNLHCRSGKPYALEHRLVMAQAIGRPLQAEEVVHHINGDKSDNRIENLELFAKNALHLKHELTGKCPKWTPEGFQRMRDCKSADGKRRRLEALQKANANRKASKQDGSQKQ